MVSTSRPVPFLFQQPYLPLEAIVLGLGGMTLAIAAMLLGPATHGVLPYYSNGLYGLLLVLFAFQTVALGKTPLGSFGCSPLMLAGGGAVAAVGVAACCIPSFHQIPRLLLLVCFGGGLVQLIRMLADHGKLHLWLQQDNIFRHLSVSCAAVYLFSTLTAFALWWEEPVSPEAVTSLLFLNALGLFSLAVILRKTYQRYPGAEKPIASRVELSATQSILLLLGIFMVLLGLLLIPVEIGLLPFAPSAQIGLLMVFFAVQMLAAGETPIGPFPRNWLMIGGGVLFAAAGIVSCIVPGYLLQPLTLVVGILNIANGLVTLCSCWRTVRQRGEPLPSTLAVLGARLFKLQFILGLLAFLFGCSMLLPGILSGMVTGLILAANGAALLGLVQLLVRIDRLQTAVAV